MKKIIDNIRKNALKSALKLIIPAVLINGVFLLMLYMTFSDGFDGAYLFIAAISGLFGIPTLIMFFKKMALFTDPFKSDVFKKYGDAEKIARIYDEIEQTSEYEDDTVIISKNYICSPNEADILIACSDVLAIHRLVHKTNFIVDYYAIVITDKYGDEFHFPYKVKNIKHKEEQDQHSSSVLEYIAKKCKNAEVGYTQDELDHIKNNKIRLNYNQESTSNDTFAAMFKNKEQKGQEQPYYNKNKSVVFNILKYLGCLVLGVLSSELILFILLGDSIDGAIALFLVLLVAIPFSFLFYYLFVGKKKLKLSSAKNAVDTQNINNHANAQSHKEKILHSIMEEKSKGNNISPHCNQETKNTNYTHICISDENYVSEKKYGETHGNDIMLQQNQENKEIAFCRKCGTKIPNDSQYCYKCGTKIN